MKRAFGILAFNALFVLCLAIPAFAVTIKIGFMCPLAGAWASRPVMLNSKGDRVGDMYRVYEMGAAGNFILK